MRLQYFQASGQISSYKYGEGGIYFNSALANPDYLFWALEYSSSIDASNKYLKLLNTAMNFTYGANQEGLTTTTGLGSNYVPNPLVRDREAMGLTAAQWPGVTCYTWGFNNVGQFNFNNFGHGTSPANFTTSEPSNGGAPDPKLIEPYQRSIPAMQQHWATTYNIYTTEFTTEGTIIPSYLAELWRWCWDGNTSTAP